MKPAASNKLGGLLSVALRSYAGGAHLREIAAEVGYSHEWVRQALLDLGLVVTIPSRRRAPELSDLAIEVFGDLEDRYGGRCSVAEMAGWLGARREEIRGAARELAARGWLCPFAADLVAEDDPPAWQGDDTAEVNDRIRDMLAAECSTHRAVAAAVGVSLRRVQGVARDGEPFGKRSAAHWSPELTERVSQLWRGGATASEIANQFGELSRNAVIGKMYRMGVRHRRLRVAA